MQQAVRSTVVSLLGNLPPHVYDTSIASTGQNVASLMYSMQMTGYMFRSAEYRRSLMESLGAAGESSGLLPPEAADVEKRNGKPQLKTKLADMPHHNEMMELNKMLLNCMRNPTFCPSTDPIICEYQRQNPYQPEVGKKAAEPKRRQTKDSQFISNVLSMEGFD